MSSLSWISCEITFVSIHQSLAISPVQQSRDCSCQVRWPCWHRILHWWEASQCHRDPRRTRSGDLSIQHPAESQLKKRIDLNIFYSQEKIESGMKRHNPYQAEKRIVDVLWEATWRLRNIKWNLLRSAYYKRGNHTGQLRWMESRLYCWDRVAVDRPLGDDSLETNWTVPYGFPPENLTTMKRVKCKGCDSFNCEFYLPR